MNPLRNDSVKTNSIGTGVLEVGWPENRGLETKQYNNTEAHALLLHENEDSSLLNKTLCV
jgi:hypothetical protein